MKELFSKKAGYYPQAPKFTGLFDMMNVGGYEGNFYEAGGNTREELSQSIKRYYADLSQEDMAWRELTPELVAREDFLEGALQEIASERVWAGYLAATHGSSAGEAA